MKRVLCLWLPNWPVQRLIRVRPELRKQPVILYHPQKSRVVACSRAACALGVRVDMTLAEATALARVRSSIHLEKDDPAADREALAKLLSWCERFSPWVGMEEAERPECLLLDTSGVAFLFGGEEALAQRVGEELGRFGLDVHMAIADTVGAAWAVAHWGPAPSSGGGQETAPQPGPHNRRPQPAIVPRGATHTALASLPVQALRLSNSILEVLQQLGIERIEQLSLLPRASLRSRFGPELLWRLDQATGAAAEVVNSHRSDPDLTAEWSFEEPTDRGQVLERVMEMLIQQISELLDQRGHGALQLTCQFDGPSVSFPIGLFQPTTSPQHLMDLVRMQWGRLRLTRSVTCIRVKVTASASLVYRQQKLMDTGGLEANSRELSVLIDRLAGRLGRDAVVQVRLFPDAQPERVCRYEPLIGSTSRRRKAPATVKKFAPLQRPLVLFPRPAPLEVVAVIPDGPPIQFCWKGASHHIAQHWGPERIETGWWRKHPVRRNYYRVETNTGYRFWLFRELGEGRWYCQGEFE